ncbi:MAG: hypothetical protein H7836_16375 [Magnetococcus sp. YQC-3]
MKNFIRGLMLGSVIGVALFWYGGIMDYFPGIVAAIILVGILIPLESQERRMEQMVGMLAGIQHRLDLQRQQQQYQQQQRQQQAELVVAVAAQADAHARAEEEPSTFIPTIQTDNATSSPTRQRKRTVDRSVGDVAKKLSSMQGG